MALTSDFKETILARARRDPAFRRALLREGVECMLSGDVETGKAVLRDFINATVGFKYDTNRLNFKRYRVRVENHLEPSHRADMGSE